MATATANKSASTNGEKLYESAAFAGSKPKVDRESFTIRGVKILGLESGNGRMYTEQAIQRAIPLYEGKSVYVNHDTKNPTSRRYEDRLGSIQGVKFVSGQGLFGDLSYNAKHPLIEQVLFDAEHETPGVGLSHASHGQSVFSGGKKIVEQINKVYSVDLVASPATTKSIYEQGGNMETEMPGTPAVSGDPMEAVMNALVDKVIEIFTGDGELSEKKKQIGELLSKSEKVKTMLSDKPKEPAGGEGGGSETATEQLTEQINELKRQLAAHDNEKKIGEKLAKAKLSREAIGDVLYEQLLGTPDAAKQDRLIEAIRPLAASRYSSPTSRDSSRAAGGGTGGAKQVETVADFVSSLKHGS